jgi:hypothetical protein
MPNGACLRHSSFVITRRVRWEVFSPPRAPRLCGKKLPRCARGEGAGLQVGAGPGRIRSAAVVVKWQTQGT